MPLPLAALDVSISLDRGDLWDPGTRPALLAFAAFLLAFLFIRTSARLMRSPNVPWWPGSVTTGSLHIHHLVWGIVLLLVSGFLAFALPDPPWREIMAVLFGIGAGLTLDEFALWLYLDDVYWAQEGRASVDAVILAATFGALVLIVGFPYASDGGDLTLAVDVGVAVLLSSVSFAKGKLVTGLVGLFVPLISLAGALRLARPESPWARWRYRGRREHRLARARGRFPGREPRLLDVIGGKPSAESK